jgi:AcrR family transcriptional regulator
MRRKSDATRQRIADAAYDSFWRLGFKRTSLDSIAARAGVTKRTLYAYFRSKDDLLAAVLSDYATKLLGNLQQIAGRMPANRDGMIDSFFAQIAWWAKNTPRWSGSGITRLAVELGDLPGHPARALARRSKKTTEGWIADRLRSVRVARSGERAREIMLLMEGAMVLMLIHGDPRYIDAAARAAKRIAARRGPSSARRSASQPPTGMRSRRRAAPR